MIDSRYLIIGGSRSGKSFFAESLIADYDQVDYLATSESRLDDPEWQQRIALHRERRPSTWTTIETIDLNEPIRAATSRPLMIDCLTIWLTRHMDRAGIWTNQPAADLTLQASFDSLVDSIAHATRPLIIVTNEVGQGIVPADPGTRRFRDEMGTINRRVAAVVDQVYLITAGIPLRLK